MTLVLLSQTTASSVSVQSVGSTPPLPSSRPLEGLGLAGRSDGTLASVGSGSSGSAPL